MTDPLLARRGNMKREKTSAGRRRVVYHAYARVSLTTSDVFVTCDATENWFAREISAEGAGAWQCSSKRCRELHNLANLGKAGHLGRPLNQQYLEKTVNAFCVV